MMDNHCSVCGSSGVYITAFEGMSVQETPQSPIHIQGPQGSRRDDEGPWYLASQGKLYRFRIGICYCINARLRLIEQRLDIEPKLPLVGALVARIRKTSKAEIVKELQEQSLTTHGRVVPQQGLNEQQEELLVLAGARSAPANEAEFYTAMLAALKHTNSHMQSLGLGIQAANARTEAANDARDALQAARDDLSTRLQELQVAYDVLKRQWDQSFLDAGAYASLSPMQQEDLAKTIDRLKNEPQCWLEFLGHIIELRKQSAQAAHRELVLLRVKLGVAESLMNTDIEAQYETALAERGIE